MASEKEKRGHTDGKKIIEPSIPDKSHWKNTVFSIVGMNTDEYHESDEETDEYKEKKHGISEKIGVSMIENEFRR